MSRFNGLLIILSLLLISGCAIKQEAVLPPAAQVKNTQIANTASITITPTDQHEITVETTAPTEPTEEIIMDSLGNADILYIKVVKDAGSNSWTFHVTVQHPDTGWEDYADGWDVVLDDGTVIKPDPESPFTRQLLHPHEAEQPFTRSQNGILIPDEVTTVLVRAHDLKDGFGGEEIMVDLNLDSGPGFEIIR